MTWRPRHGHTLVTTREQQQEWLVYRYVEQHARCTLRQVCTGVCMTKGNAESIVRRLAEDRRLVELHDDDAPVLLVVVKGRAPL